MTPVLTRVFYDGALRSVNIDPLVKAGLNVVSPPNKGIPTRFIRTIMCTACGDEHRFGSHAGWLCLIDYLDDGTEAYEFLEDRKVSFVGGPDTYRCYVTVCQRRLKTEQVSTSITAQSSAVVDTRPIGHRRLATWGGPTPGRSGMGPRCAGAQSVSGE